MSLGFRWILVLGLCCAAVTCGELDDVAEQSIKTDVIQSDDVVTDISDTQPVNDTVKPSSKDSSMTKEEWVSLDLEESPEDDINTSSNDLGGSQDVSDVGAVSSIDVPVTKDTAIEEDTNALPATCFVGQGNCPAGYFCRAPGCDDGIAGTCLASPKECPDDVVPVCACGDITFDNECIASQAGLNVDYNGACEEPVTLCLVGEPGCEVNEYCKGKCTKEGECTAKPLSCPDDIKEVCGCNGETYTNECLAAGAGQNVSYLGKCKPPAGKSCAGKNETQCPETQGCNITGCAADKVGSCVNLGTICLGPPECGCDGVTYTDFCKRIKAGVAKKHVGECLPDGSIPVCQIGVEGECLPSLFCDGPGCSGEGTCKAKPLVCVVQTPFEACGCDGKTYKSSCHAHKAGISVKSGGKCSEN